MTKSTQFDLEDAIMTCWNTSSDIELLIAHVGDQSYSTDSLLNIAQGIKELHDLRCHKLFSIFESWLADSANK